LPIDLVDGKAGGRDVCEPAHQPDAQARSAVGGYASLLALRVSAAPCLRCGLVSMRAAQNGRRSQSPATQPARFRRPAFRGAAGHGSIGLQKRLDGALVARRLVMFRGSFGFAMPPACPVVADVGRYSRQPFLPLVRPPHFPAAAEGSGREMRRGRGCLLRRPYVAGQRETPPGKPVAS
jgi:hypothetical protein